MGHQLLRLWTVKEALFKADPNNADSTLLDYRVLALQELAGWAEPPPDRRLSMRYATMPLPAGFVTVAISFGPSCSHGD